METTQMQARSTATLLAVGCIFGSSFLMVKLLVTEMPPAHITAWRLLFGGIPLVALLAARGELGLPSRSLAGKATVLALLDSVIPNTLLAWAQIRVDSSIAAVLISSMPLFTVLFAMALPRNERISSGKVFGLALGIVGVALLVGADTQHAAGGAPAAHLAVVLAAMSNAAAVVYARALLANERPLQLSAFKLMLGAVIAMTLAGALDGGHTVPRMSVPAWCVLLALGVLSNALGRTMYLSLIASAGSVRASLVAYIVPVVGILLGWLVLGEQIGASAAPGIALIASGMVLVTHGAQIGSRVPQNAARSPAAARLLQRG
jgi:drug/metabolite transporter (DMT)-like permease